jgi:hypothetical protein
VTDPIKVGNIVKQSIRNGFTGITTSLKALIRHRRKNEKPKHIDIVMITFGRIYANTHKYHGMTKSTIEKWAKEYGVDPLMTDLRRITAEVFIKMDSNKGELQIFS